MTHDGKRTVAVLGIGGVGGYIGAHLAWRHGGADDVRIVFIARGENAAAIRERGLRLITAKGEFTARPPLVSDDPGAIGPIDLLLCCTKSYDLESAVGRLRPCLPTGSIVIPFLNGVDSTERVQAVAPEADAWMGTAWISSRLIAPGVVKAPGETIRFVFGSKTAGADAVESVKALFDAAGIEARLSDDIERVVWEKFLFLSPLASLESRFDTEIGRIAGSEEGKKLLIDLVAELRAIGEASGINLPHDAAARAIARIEAIPAGINSSMLDDFRRGGATEVETLAGHVVRVGARMNVPTPAYTELYAGLKTIMLERQGKPGSRQSIRTS